MRDHFFVYTHVPTQSPGGGSSMKCFARSRRFFDGTSFGCLDRMALHETTTPAKSREKYWSSAASKSLASVFRSFDAPDAISMASQIRTGSFLPLTATLSRLRTRIRSEERR